MITVLKILVVLFLIVLVIIMVFKPRKKEGFVLPDHFKDLLEDYIAFYRHLDEQNKKHFIERLEKFFTSVKITGVNAEVEDMDRVFIGAAAIIPVFYIRDWEYVHLKEVLVYPGNFNHDFEQRGTERDVLGMVGTGALQNVMILSKWELRHSFINEHSGRNTAIHEFVHLVDKMDGTFDGVPEILLERKHVPRFAALLQELMQRIREGRSAMDFYATTNPVECFAVLCEYFFMQPAYVQQESPELYQYLRQIFRTPD